MSWIGRPNKDGLWLWRLPNSLHIGVIEMLDGEICSRSLDDGEQEWIAAEEWIACDPDTQYHFVGEG